MHPAGRPALRFPAVSQNSLAARLPLAQGTAVAAVSKAHPALVTGRRLPRHRAPGWALSAVAQRHPYWGRSAVPDVPPAERGVDIRHGHAHIHHSAGGKIFDSPT